MTWPCRQSIFCYNLNNYFEISILSKQSQSLVKERRMIHKDEVKQLVNYQYQVDCYIFCSLKHFIFQGWQRSSEYEQVGKFVCGYHETMCFIYLTFENLNNCSITIIHVYFIMHCLTFNTFVLDQMIWIKNQNNVCR